ncbi:hypothetical protein Scep_028555 [Stephania cephalantha]|uniref:Uncharacterized protein n=1 Tax=Stephania cephalantha TaxID=152367 RepID=A0AAP0HI91_9MAGN
MSSLHVGLSSALPAATAVRAIHALLSAAVAALFLELASVATTLCRRTSLHVCIAGWGH